MFQEKLFYKPVAAREKQTGVKMMKMYENSDEKVWKFWHHLLNLYTIKKQFYRIMFFFNFNKF